MKDEERNLILRSLPKPILDQYQSNTNVLRGTRLCRLIENQVLFEQNAPAENCFLVLQGSIKIAKNTGHRETILTIISEGEIGGALLMNPMIMTSFPGSITAVTRTLALKIPKSTYLDSWVNNPSIGAFVSACVQGRILNMQKEKEIQISEVDVRVANFLYLHFVDKKDLNGKKITKKQIAQSIGAKTETVIRVMKKFENQKLIKVNSSIIEILKPSDLLDISKK